LETSVHRVIAHKLEQTLFNSFWYVILTLCICGLGCFRPITGVCVFNLILHLKRQRRHSSASFFNTTCRRSHPEHLQLLQPSGGPLVR